MPGAFAVAFDLASPLIMDRGINLARLLAWAIDEDDPIPLAPLTQADGVFAGSDLFVLGPSLDYHVA